MAPKTPVIAIVGRPNVGKSTLFNRVLGEKRAIVEDTPGVTRDRNYALIERFKVPFLLVDTGGFETDPEGEIEEEVVKQTLVAAEEADIVISLFDGSAGCQPGDRDVVDLLRRYNKPVFYVVNKCDGEEQGMRVNDFYQLGIDTIYDCSALHGRRVTVLIETILATLPNYQALLDSAKAIRARIEEAAKFAQQIAAQDEDSELDNEDYEDPDEIDEEPEEEETSRATFAPVFIPEESEQSAEAYEKEHRLLPLDWSEPREDGHPEPEDFDIEDAPVSNFDIPTLELIRVAIVGRPNVGKSTLLNTLSGEKRAITSPIAGTTRDTLDLKVRREGQDFLLVDTAGLRKQARVTESLEHYSTMRSIRALTEADVAVVMIDATSGPKDQDAKILGLAHERGAGIVIVVNKWDLVEKTHRTVHEFTTQVREAFKFAPYAPVLFISAESGRRCPRVLDTVLAVARERTKRIATNSLNRTLQKALKSFSPSPYRGRDIKLYYGVQVDVAPPRFSLFFNYPRALHFSFLRYLKNSVRNEFGFEGTDIKLMPRRRQ